MYIYPRHLNIAKKIQARQFSQYCLSEKAPGFNIPKIALVDDLTFQFWVSSFKNVEFMDRIVRFFVLKSPLLICTSLAAKSSFSNIHEPITFLYMTLNANFFFIYLIPFQLNFYAFMPLCTTLSQTKENKLNLKTKVSLPGCTCGHPHSTFCSLDIRTRLEPEITNHFLWMMIIISRYMVSLLVRSRKNFMNFFTFAFPSFLLKLQDICIPYDLIKTYYDHS